MRESEIQTLAVRSLVPLGSCKKKSPAGLAHPRCALHLWSTPSSARRSRRTAEAFWEFYLLPATSRQLAAESARRTQTVAEHVTTCQTFCKRCQQERDILMVTRRTQTSDFMKSPKLSHDDVPCSYWNASSINSLNMSSEGLMSSVLNLWPAHHPKSTSHIDQMVVFFSIT